MLPMSATIFPQLLPTINFSALAGVLPVSTTLVILVLFLMLPFRKLITTILRNTAVTLGQPAIGMEGASYQAVQSDTGLYIREIKDDVQKDYEVLWALGGKNVYYFLTPWEGGRLQTLPLAYDVHTRQWYNNPESAVRHFPNMNGVEEEDQALSWRDMQYTFNTSCYSCHVSQLENNFDLATNTYQTHWKEAGINCETCHGPAKEHTPMRTL